ncbi:MAG TPA: phosphate/phosphite/phosphonate ABC transporter substrate-binding protein [Geminicoccaceae bacterium]|nr:phosphate/phosphite/phosphonate ABC transporter substrate-binding protein [Geminicoccaceae bacterium]
MRWTRRQALTAVTLAGSLIGIGSASADWREEVPAFRIGVLGGELAGLRLEDHACLKAATERTLGVPVELFASRDYSGVNEGLRAGTLDTAGLGAAGYAGLFVEDPDLVEPLVTVKQEDGLVGYHSVLFVRADSPYRTLDDLRNKSLAFTERLSTSGFLIPYHELSEQGYRPGRFFGRYGFSGGHPQAVTAVLSGEFDAGVTWSSNIGDYDQGFSRGNLRRMVDRGLLNMSDLRILWTSELIPDGPYVVRKALPQEVKDLYRQVLLDLADRDRPCFEGIVGGDAIDFEPITEEYYDSMIAVLRDS